MSVNRVVNVAINGYGVIGKRIAEAVSRQDDMRLVGVADVTTDWRVWPLEQLGVPLDVVETVREMYESSAHKRAMPPGPDPLY